MDFGVQDLQDLIQLLEQHPEWKSLLRASLLGDELLRLPAAVEELAEAQRRTERAVGLLAQQVGRLSDVVGFTLEELARELAPAYLAERYGIRVSWLERQFFVLDGEEVEIDFYGEGTRDGERIVVISEARSRIYGRDVESLARKAMDLAPQLASTQVPALFGYVIHPSAREVAARTGALVIAATGKA